MGPGVVILNAGCPELAPFCTFIRSNPGTAHISVLHLAPAYRFTDDFTTELNRHADACLTGAEDPAVIVSVVRTLLRLSEARRASTVHRHSEEALRSTHGQLQRLIRKLLFPAMPRNYSAAANLALALKNEIAGLGLLLASLADPSRPGTSPVDSERSRSGAATARELLKKVESLEEYCRAQAEPAARFPEGVREAARRFTQKRGANVSLDVSRAIPPMDPDLGAAVCRAAEESLQVLDCCESRSFRIAIRRRKAMIAVEARGEACRTWIDSGGEIPTSEAALESDTLLTSLRERAGYFGGTCSVFQTRNSIVLCTLFPISRKQAFGAARLS